MEKNYSLSDFDYTLPEGKIATAPATPREAARLLVWPEHGADAYTFANLPEFLNKGDVLVLNNTRVIPARMFATRPRDQQEGVVHFEVLLHKPVRGVTTWEAFVRPAKRLKVGHVINLPQGVTATVEARDGDRAVLAFAVPEEQIFAYFEQVGEMPLPPYIERPEGATEADKADYQTVFAQHNGSVAAPTAGLHFSEKLLETLRAKGVEIQYVTLHVGAGTFQPVRVENLSEHKMHSEWGQVPQTTVEAISAAKARGNHVVAVGTTALRILEGAALAHGGQLQAFQGETDIFITPGYRFNVVDKLVTNFHLPKSTLLMLVSAFIGYAETKQLYAHAIDGAYKFYSYGDGCLLTRKD